MTTAEFSHAVRQIRPYTQYIYLHVKRRTAASSAAGRVSGHCTGGGLQVNLTTNGTLLSRRQELLLSKPALRQVNISLHSLPEQSGLPNFTQEGYLDGCVRFARAASARPAAPCYTVFRMWNLESGGENAPFFQ